jgi:hypothetical protein
MIFHFLNLIVFFTIFMIQKINYSVIGSNETESDFCSITALLKKQ